MRRQQAYTPVVSLTRKYARSINRKFQLVLLSFRHALSVSTAGLEPINSCKYIYINMIYTNIISAITSFFPGNCLLHCSCEGRTAWHMKEHSIWLEQNMSTSGFLEPCNQDQLTQAFRISKKSTSNSFRSLPLGRLSEDYLENTSSAWANVCGLLRFEDSSGEKKLVQYSRLYIFYVNIDNEQGDQKINSDRQTCESSIGKAAPNQNNQLFLVLYSTYQTPRRTLG